MTVRRTVTLRKRMQIKLDSSPSQHYDSTWGPTLHLLPSKHTRQPVQAWLRGLSQPISHPAWLGNAAQDVLGQYNLLLLLLSVSLIAYCCCKTKRVSQRQICFGSEIHCNTEIEATNSACNLTKAQNTDIPTTRVVTTTTLFVHQHYNLTWGPTPVLPSS